MSILEQNKIDARSLRPLFPDQDSPIYAIPVAGKDATAIWKQLRNATSQTHYWPVLIGDEDNVAALYENQEALADLTATTVLERADRLDVSAWLEQRELEEPDYYDPPRGPWPENPSVSNDLSAAYDLLTGNPLDSLKLALLPVDAGWQVPAHLRFGSWNDCPPPEVHVALLRRWQAEYGAELAVLGGDTIELTVARPPKSREAALTLAREYFLYAPDSIYQGFESLDALAASLMVSHTWFFWWD